MKRYLLLYAVCTTALLVYGYRRHRSETERLVQNQTALNSEVENYRNRLGEAAASVQVLRLHCSEYEKLRSADAEHIRRLGIRLRRLEAAAKTVTVTEAEFHAPLNDSLPPGHPERGSRCRAQPSGPPSSSLSVLLPSLPDVSLQPYSHDRSRVADEGTKVFRWHDTWVTVEGSVTADSVRCRVESIDTLRQVVYRVPRRFLFFRWGTKAIRQEISSSNPHTRIIWTEYVKFEKRP